MEQFVWLIKSGLIETRHARQLQKISAKAELFGFIGSISLKIRDLNRFNRELCFLQTTIEISIAKGMEYEEEAKQIQKLKEKKLMNWVSIVQNLADVLVVQANIRDGKGRLREPIKWQGV
ncbi:hypothetical protein PVL29_017671 [Vitis rotundifolia]|uniref:Uncharacterized protein n=1 Tax=Vitis rotundifolia TaxID=103349 RepID=A0AA38ZB26_VITRO|nr:hypothetical protein PVL29_017671 [Vitis rotundifolia]